MPSESPSALPTFSFGANDTSRAQFELTFEVDAPASEVLMNNVSQHREFEIMMENYTFLFAPDTADQVWTVCTYDKMALKNPPLTLPPAMASTVLPEETEVPLATTTTTTVPTVVATTPAPTIAPSQEVVVAVDVTNNNNESTTTAATEEEEEPPPADRLFDSFRRLTKALYQSWGGVVVADDTNSSSSPMTTSNRNLRERDLQDEQPSKNEYVISFLIRYESRTTNVSTYPAEFTVFIVNNATIVQEDLTELLQLDPAQGLVIKQIQQFETASMAPTVSAAPSEIPTEAPTISPAPTNPPTQAPTFAPDPTALPTIAPTILPPPTTSPTEVPKEDDDDLTVIVVSVVVVAFVASVVMVLIIIFYRQRQIKLEIQQAQLAQKRRSNAIASGGGGGAVPVPPPPSSAVAAASVPDVYSTSGVGSLAAVAGAADAVAAAGGSPYTRTPASGGPPNDIHRARGLMAPTSAGESIFSNPSLLSNGPDDESDMNDDSSEDPLHIGGPRGGGPDGMFQVSPLDDFDRYKDQNLEKMRSRVEDNVSGMDGMMSQALTLALMDGPATYGGGGATEEATKQHYWGSATTGMEIEANALCEVTDWMKRHEGAPLDEK
jgi:type II secretory pathway pseudopilin PulG